jgi:hypothetical protein
VDGFIKGTLFQVFFYIHTRNCWFLKLKCVTYSTRGAAGNAIVKWTD